MERLRSPDHHDSAMEWKVDQLEYRDNHQLSI